MKKIIEKLYNFKRGLLAMTACLLWSSAVPTIKNTYMLLKISSNDIYSKILLAGIRFFTASIIIMSIKKFTNIKKTKFNKKATSSTSGILGTFMSLQAKCNFLKYKKKVVPIMILGILHTTLQYFFFYIGIDNTTGIKAVILSQSSIFFVVIFSHFAYEDDRLNLRKGLALLIGTLGIYVINFNSLQDLVLYWYKPFSEDFFHFSLIGEGFLLMAGIVNALGVFLAKKITKDAQPISITAYQMFFGSTILLIFSFKKIETIFKYINVQVVILLLYSSILSAVAFSIWYSLLKKYKAAEITIFKFIIPISGSILSSIFLPDEHFTMIMIMGLILISGSIYLSVRQFKNEKVIKNNL